MTDDMGLTYRLCVDTTGSWDGDFPEAKKGCFIVGLNGVYDYEIILVSSRYTGATSPGDAATIAVDAYHESEGCGVPWPGMGRPFYHVDVWPALDPDDRNKVTGVVQQNEDNDWDWIPAEEKV
jgi:hypothetical protein